MSEAIADIPAERGVLSGLFSYGGQAFDDICDITTAKTFTTPQNQALFRCIESILKTTPDAPIDYPSVLSSAQALGLGSSFETEEDRRYIRAVANFPVKKETVRRLAGKIRKLEVGRMLLTQLDVAKANIAGITGDERIDDIMRMAQEPVFDFGDLLTEQDSGPRLMGEGAAEYLLYLMDNPREMMGISTGFAALDEAIGGGIRPNSVDIIAARPKTGKTFLVDNVCLKIAAQGIPVYNGDTEMTWEEHIHRIAAYLSGFPIHDIETGKVGLKDVSRQKIIEVAARLKDMPYHYECVIGKQFEDILASKRRWVTRTVGLDGNGKAKPCVIAYDYLKMMSTDFLSNDLKEYQALGFITTALKNFMGRYGVGCLCFAQLNRDGIDKEDTDALSGSDRIVHYCTSLTFYKEKTDDERAESGPDGQKYTHKLVPLISRHGKGLKRGDYINIQADYARGRVIEGPTRYQLESGSQQRPGTRPAGIVLDASGSEESIPFAAD